MFFSISVVCFGQNPGPNGQIWREYPTGPIYPPNIVSASPSIPELPMKPPTILDFVKRENDETTWIGPNHGTIREEGPKRRDELIQKLKEKYVLVPICLEQLGGMSTPRTSETLPQGGTGADVLDHGLRLIAPETGEDVTDFHIRGGEYTLEIALIAGAKKAYLKGGSPSCDKDGIAGEILRRGGVQVVRVGRPSSNITTMLDNASCFPTST